MRCSLKQPWQSQRYVAARRCGVAKRQHHAGASLVSLPVQSVHGVVLFFSRAETRSILNVQSANGVMLPARRQKHAA